MKPFKILLDARGTQDGFKQHKQRGIGHYAQNLLERLPVCDLPLQFFYLVNHGQPIEPSLRLPSVPFLEHRVCPAFSKISSFFETQFCLPSTLRKMPFDLVHFLGHEDPTLWTPYPYVMTVHDLIPWVQRSLYSLSQRMKQSVVFSFVERFARQAKAIITVSEHSKKDIVRYFHLPPEKIKVIYHGIEERYRDESLPIQAKNIINRYKLPPKFLLYVGGIDPRKNIRMLLQAMVRLTDQKKQAIPLVMAGLISGQREYPQVKQWIRTWGLTPHVIELGFIPVSDLPALYAAASVFLFPSRYEGFGLPVLEAMAAGTPVVTTRCASIPEVAGEAALYTDPDRPNALADAVLSLLEDPEAVSRCVAQGKEQARKFSWEKTARETGQLYLNVLQNRPL